MGMAHDIYEKTPVGQAGTMSCPTAKEGDRRQSQAAVREQEPRPRARRGTGSRPQEAGRLRGERDKAREAATAASKQVDPSVFH